MSSVRRLVSSALLSALLVLGLSASASAANYFDDCPWWKSGCRVDGPKPVSANPEPGAALLFAAGALWVARRTRKR